MSKNCTYSIPKIFGNKSFNYSQLMSKLLNNDEIIDDLVFALGNVDKQKLTHNRLLEIKESNMRTGSRRVNGEFEGYFKKKNEQSEYFDQNYSEIATPNDDYTIQRFINSNLYVDEDGKPFIIPLDQNQAKEKLEEENKQSMPASEAKAKAERTIKNWNKVSEDCRDFHRIILQMNGEETSFQKMVNLTEGTVFDRMIDTLRDGPDSVYDQIHRQVRYVNGKRSREIGDSGSSIIMKNIKISSNVIGRDSKVHGHIDFLAIKPDGSIEVFLIRGSYQSSDLWDYDKKESYQHEIAFLARMLQNNGINTNNIRFNIIPAVLKYDDEYENVTDINIENAICFSHRNGAYVMHDNFKKAARFISASVTPLTIESESVERVNKQLRTFIPDGSVRTFGLLTTINDYIDKNWYYWKRGNQPESGHRLTINGKVYDIKDSREKSENPYVVEIVEKLQKELIDTESGILSTRGIITQYKDSRRTGKLQFENITLNELLAPYLEVTSEVTINDKTHYNYKWELVENDDINNFNILLFKNVETGQIDVVSLTSLDIDKKYKLNRRENIAGFHVTDVDAVDNQGKSLLNSTYGNIETMRILFLLNELIPNLDSDIKLGDVTIIGNLGLGSIKSQTYPVSMLLSNFAKVKQLVNDADPTLKMENNFNKIETVSEVDLLIRRYVDIMQNNTGLAKTGLEQLRSIILGSDQDKKQHTIGGDVISSLATAESTEVKIERLEELIKQLQIIVQGENRQHSLSPDDLIKYSKLSNNSKLKFAATLLIEASITLDRLTGNIRIVDSELSAVDKNISRPQNMKNSQVRLVGKLLQDAIHATASRMDPEVSEFVNECLNFYKQAGYGKLENFTLGTQSRVFKNLYQDIDDQLLFKNPYDPNNNLKDYEREFLKKVITRLRKIRIGVDDITGKSQNEINKIIEKDDKFFWVPLAKASKSTRVTNTWSNPMQYAEELKSRVSDYCKEPGKYFREFYEGIFDETQQEIISQDMRDLQAYNAFRQGETTKGRERLNSIMREKGKDYFETNLQNLVIDYVHKHIQEEEMNAMLIKTRGILLYLKLKGEKEIPAEGSKDRNKYEQLIKYIDNYVTTSVYNKSIMDPEFQRLNARIMPLRKLVTRCYITNNPEGFVRDVLGGIISNIIRPLFKYRTDIDVSDVIWAYQYVLRKGSLSSMSIDLLDKLNSKYLISNINIEQQQEGYKSNTQGLSSDNWKYWSLKKPDYLNRMVLFVAKLKHDGSIGAYYVDNGQLKYNWRLDKRFNLLANKDKSDPEKYNKQASLYLSQIVAYNEENPRNKLKVSLDQDLPEGYTLNQIESIKDLANTIYGAYSLSEKSGYEHTFLGQQFLVFSTWMNGIWDVYFGKRRESSYLTEKRHKEDENGNKLYFDENGNITTTITDKPVLTDVPVIVQGVLYTLLNIGDILLFQSNKLEAFKRDILRNKMQMSNIRRLISDLLIYFLLSNLFKHVFDPEYKEHKKESSGEDYFENYIIELMYHGGEACYEEFKGPFPILGYVTENTKPAAFQWSQKFMNDSRKLIFGDKTIGEYVIGMNAFARSMQDTYKMYQRDVVKQNTVDNNKQEK